MKRICFFACLFLSLNVFGNKIVYLLSAPRSMSTMFLRMMEARDDFEIYSEPTVTIYCRKHLPIYTPDWEWDDNFKTFSDVKDSVFSDLKKRNVFIKDLGYTAHESLLGDIDFLKNSKVHFLCLLRSPHEILLSFYAKLGEVIDGQSNMVSLKTLYEEYELIKRVNPNGIKIMFSNDLCEFPREVMKAYCSHLNIPFTEKMFTWKEHDENFDLHKNWHEQKKKHVTDHWHDRALKTRSIGKRTTYSIDENGDPTFEEIENEDDRKQFKKFYEENIVYYKKFLEAKEDFLFVK